MKKRKIQNYSKFEKIIWLVVFVVILSFAIYLFATRNSCDPTINNFQKQPPCTGTFCERTYCSVQDHQWKTFSSCVAGGELFISGDNCMAG